MLMLVSRTCRQPLIHRQYTIQKHTIQLAIYQNNDGVTGNQPLFDNLFSGLVLCFSSYLVGKDGFEPPMRTHSAGLQPGALPVQPLARSISCFCFAINSLQSPVVCFLLYTIGPSMSRDIAGFFLGGFQ